MQHSEFRAKEFGQPKTRKRTFKAKIPDSEETYDIDIYTLEDPRFQDVIQWLSEFEKAKNECKWSDNTSIQILKRCINNELNLKIESIKTYDEAIIRIKEICYPEIDFDKYLNKLIKIKQMNYETIHEYLTKFNKLTKQTNMCLKPSEQLRERELFKYFLTGLSPRNQSIVVNQGLRTIEEMVNKIQNIEELEKQMMNLNFKEQEVISAKEKYCKKTWTWKSWDFGLFLL
ncbi:hypothetical protein H312_03171 [Anncaliia algerae PRA339]|uniref:Ty3 transposon capsid-like protein domain-containing protein n=1 Tax=Anncaliia algerae PRA339 TaxID=1288291 RepID=A0A059EXF9_9MICR|nr:hypothetical protein H312_03171 [Anncaliia algerae PRA339]